MIVFVIVVVDVICVRIEEFLKKLGMVVSVKLIVM